MRLERLNNLSCNAVKADVFSIQVFIFNSRLVYRNNFLLKPDRGEKGSHHVSLRLLGGEGE